MGRYKYDKFTDGLSDETRRAIAHDLANNCSIMPDDYDWGCIDIRVKRANKAQRHRFADTIQKLEAYIRTTEANIEWIHILTVREFANITGRNRKTVEDWAKKGFIKNHFSLRHNRMEIEVEETIKKIGQIHRL